MGSWPNLNFFFTRTFLYAYALQRSTLLLWTHWVTERDGCPYQYVSLWLSVSLCFSVFLCVSMPIYIFFNLCLFITMFLSLSICNSVSLNDTLSLWLPSLVLYLGPEKVLYPGILVTSQRQIWQPILPGSIALLENKEPAVSHQGIINSKLVTQLHSFFFIRNHLIRKSGLKSQKIKKISKNQANLIT